VRNFTKTGLPLKQAKSQVTYKVKVIVYLLLLLIAYNKSFAQNLCTGSLGDPIVNITFGSGPGNASPLPVIVPGASTTYSFVSTSGVPVLPVPLDGSYTISNGIPFNNPWFGNAPDHTPGDVNGYMAFFNASSAPSEFYRQTINGLCPNTRYEFAAWIANALNPAVMSGQAPNITFQVLDLNGNVLNSIATGNIQQTQTLTWLQYGFFFSTPAGTSSVVLRMINTNPGGANFPGNDLAVDDITFRACGPTLTASFQNGVIEATKTQCNLNAVTLFGTTTNVYSAPAYQWQVSSNNGSTWIDLPNSNSLSTVYTPGSQGRYLFRMLSAEAANITSSSCRVVSNLVTLQISAPPTITITPPSAICFGDSIRLSASGGITYQWTPASTLNNPSSEQPIAKPIVTTIYKVFVTTANGCIDSASTTITINPLPIIQVLPSSPAICIGDTIQLIASGGENYQWTPATGLSNHTSSMPFAFPLTTTQYRLAAIAANGCRGFLDLTVTVNPKPTATINQSQTICDGDSAQLSASGGFSYQWSPLIGLSNPGSASPKASPMISTNYKVVVRTIAGCSDSASTMVFVNSKPSVTINRDTTVCNGDSAQLQAGGGISYAWAPSRGLSNPNSSTTFASPINTTRYAVVVTNNFGCKDSATTTVSVFQPPLLFKNRDTIICSGSVWQADASVIPGSIAWTWQDASTQPTFLIKDPGTYWVQTNATGCKNPVRDSIHVDTTGKPVVWLGSDFEVCQFENLRVPFFGRNYTSYIWSTGSQDSVIQITTSGTYTITATNKCGTNTDNIKVAIKICGDDLYFPSAFTPNLDGKNDRYRAAYLAGLEVHNYELRIYNRWGQLLFRTNQQASGWDGRVNGLLQGSNTFVWYAQYRKTQSGPLIKKSGTFILIR
jgi:gliding motility-associated-like protein